MKHYLLTWYGITDLRAALGFEKSDGPILSALTQLSQLGVVLTFFDHVGNRLARERG
jgi:hypothetical protein